MYYFSIFLKMYYGFSDFIKCIYLNRAEKPPVEIRPVWAFLTLCGRVRNPGYPALWPCPCEGTKVLGHLGPQAKRTVSNHVVNTTPNCIYGCRIESIVSYSWNWKTIDKNSKFYRKMCIKWFIWPPQHLKGLKNTFLLKMYYIKCTMLICE